jgi:hypothetical protein
VRHVLLNGCQPFQAEFQGVGQRGDGEEGRRRDPAGLDLAEGLGGDPGPDGDVQHAAVTAGGAQQPAETFAAFPLGRGQRHSHHPRMIIPV